MKLSGELHTSAAFRLLPIEYQARSLLEMELCSSIRDYLTVENVGKEVSWKLKSREHVPKWKVRLEARNLSLCQWNETSELMTIHKAGLSGISCFKCMLEAIN
jgi:hypothetical protein